MFTRVARPSCLALLFLLTLTLALPSFGQATNDVYQLGYFHVVPILQLDGAGTVTSFTVINTGQVGSPIDAATNSGTVCADIYFFDTNQEMLSCCSCPITANGMTKIHPGTPLTRVRLLEGVIKVVSDQGCDETNISRPVPGGLRVFGTNAQSLGHSTETLFQSAPLTSTEQAFLGQACSFVHYLGSGIGRCDCPVDFAGDGVIIIIGG